MVYIFIKYSKFLLNYVFHCCLLQLEHHTKPWHDVVFGPIVYDVASIEGDPVSTSCV